MTIKEEYVKVQASREELILRAEALNKERKELIKRAHSLEMEIGGITLELQSVEGELRVLGRLDAASGG